MKKMFFAGLVLVSCIFCINVNAEVTVERNFPYTDGSLDIIFKDIEISSDHTYKWAIEKLESTEPTTYFELMTPDYDNSEVKISVLSTNETQLAVLKSVNDAYITIKDDQDNVVLDSYKVDLTLDPFAGFNIEKSIWYGSAPANPAYEVTASYGIVNKNIQFMFEKIEDADVINNYVDNNKDLSGLNLKGISDKPSDTDTRWTTVEVVSGIKEGRINNQDLPTETGLYYLWVKGSGTDIKTIYGYNVIEVGTVTKVTTTEDNKNETTDVQDKTEEVKDTNEPVVKDEVVESPKTGLADYAVIIIGGLALIVAGIAVVNKNKKFKRI